MTYLELTGLRADHPLGFLAACGLLRCLSDCEDVDEVRLGWQAKDRERFALLDTRQPVKIGSIAEMLRCRGREFSESPALTWSGRVNDTGKYRNRASECVRSLLSGDSRDAVDMLAALGSELIAEDGKLRSTHFDLTSGNQQFLKSLRDLSNDSVLTDDAVREALIGPWEYQDEHHSLGWDPQVQRLHALRGKVPEKDKAGRSVAAAVFLAGQALPLFPCFAVGGKLRTTGFSRHDEDDRFTWPIWRDPISPTTLRSLLGHPFTPELKERGVDMVYCCRRAHTGGSQGNYQIFSYSLERPWPVRQGPRRRSRLRGVAT